MQRTSNRVTNQTFFAEHLSSSKGMLLLLGICLLVAIQSIRHFTVITVGKLRTDKTFYRREDFPSPIQFKHGETGKSVHHIVFLKVPKAASTTIANIFLRYGDEKNLIFAVPRNHKPGGYSFTSQYFLPPPKNRSYDIACAHARYNRTHYSKVFPNDTVYIAIMREPFQHFKSYVRFFRPKRILHIPGKNPVLNFLSSNEKTWNSSARAEPICNSMARYLGFPRRLFFQKWNQSIAEEFIHKLKMEIDLVLILEFLDESLVLMRRMLNWDLRHVLHGRLHVTKSQDLRLKFGTDEANLHKKCAHLDYQLYGLFFRKLKETLKTQPPDFFEEVAYFRKVRVKYNNFCSSAMSETDLHSTTAFEGSVWNKPFVISREHCKKLIIQDVDFLDYLLEKQNVSEDVFVK
ncbi:galactose-3-O-sulfotransferase 2-like [Ylistrum balloti]|uniref:galactose-3-O-sulfotransferase 2-like n=1 Tax=Ylistrum balloti TaxID=509963 RepID=UPI002905DBF8|nr:galactose-3-O-sulfotransferase 2-like [Ylistrum balloti]